LAKTLRLLLEERNLTIEDVAVATEIKRATIGDWLAGTSPRNMQDARTVARYLGVTFHYLCFGHSEDDVSAIINSAPTEMILDGIFRLRLEKIKSGSNDEEK